MSLMESLKTSFVSMTLGEKVLGGLQVALFGMAIVFSILVFIMLGIHLLEKMAGDSKKVPSVSISMDETKMPTDQTESIEDYGELVAVISAVIAVSLSTSTHNIVVRNITRVQDPTPLWGKMGRIQQLR